MSKVTAFLAKYHRAIIYTQLGLIAFFLLACTFHDVLPICHWLFKCDHMLHM